MAVAITGAVDVDLIGVTVGRLAGCAPHAVTKIAVEIKAATKFFLTLSSIPLSTSAHEIWSKLQIIRRCIITFAGVRFIRHVA